MTVTITEGHAPAEDRYVAEELALTEIEARGWHGIGLDFDTDEEDLHWHDFASITFIISGTFNAYDADADRWYTLGPGTSIEAPAGVVHREQDSHFRGVIGIDRPLDQITEPINKPVADLVS